jgi:hypothetical protein
MIRRTEGFHYNDATAIQVEDVVTIEAWLDGIDAEKSKQVTDQSSVWTIKTNLPYPCEVSYDPEMLKAATIRLSTEKAGDTIAANKRRLQEIIADHGAQSYGRRITGATIEEGEFSQIVWGAEQLVSLTALCPELFWAIIKRLKASMDDALQSLGG